MSLVLATYVALASRLDRFLLPSLTSGRDTSFLAVSRKTLKGALLKGNAIVYLDVNVV